MDPRFTITNLITQGLAQIERARGFLEAAQLSEHWVRQMSEQALLLEAHHTTHIEGTRLTLTISEYYDRNRSAFYGALQGVREADMDLTGWLDYYVTGLATQLEEVKERGKLAIQVDMLGQANGLNPRQIEALRHLTGNSTMSIHEYQSLYPSISRRTLQRDLKAMAEKDIISIQGGTNQLIYQLSKTF